MLLLGTDRGVFRWADHGGRTVPSRVLDVGRVAELFSGGDGVYAASERGLFVSRDRGETWVDLEVPVSDVWATHTTGGRVYAGCYPAHLFVSEDAGRWVELDGLTTAPGADRWFCPGDDDSGRVRTIRTVPVRPSRLLVGIEVGGLYVSDDRGRTWRPSRGLPADDVHHVAVTGPDEYLVSCGKLELDRGYGPGGAFRTVDGGTTWNRLELGPFGYVRESLVVGTTVFVSGARRTPGEWDGPRGAGAAVFESDDAGSSFDAVMYPGEPRDMVLSWATDGDRVYAGTGGGVGGNGRLIRREPDGWIEIARLGGNVRSVVGV